MKNFYTLLSILLFSGLAFSQNLANNGGMENWTSGVLDTWTSEAGTTISQESTIKSEGSYSAKFDVTTQAQGDTDFRQTVSVEAGRTYNVSVDIYQGDNEARARLYVGDYRDYSDPELVGEWQTISYEYQATATEDIEIGLRFYDVSNWVDGSTIYVDNFLMEEQQTTAPSITITSPEDGANLAPNATSVQVSFVTNNFTIGAPGAGADGHIHYFLDGTQQGLHTTSDPITVTDLTEGEHTVKLQLRDDSHQPFNPDVFDEVTFTVPSSSTVSTVSELRSGSQDGTVYTLTGEVFLTMQQSYRNQKWVQDATAGILIDDNSGVVTSTYNRYDGLTGITGTLTEYNGVLQFVPTQDPGAASSTGNTVTPEVVSVADFNANPDMYESELIKVTGLTTAETGDWTNGTSYDFSDGSNTVIVRTNFYDVDYIGTALPTQSVDITGIAGEYQGTAQFYPRDMNDIQSSMSVNEVASQKVVVYIANNNLIISGADVKTAQVFNTSGRLVKTASNNEFNVASLPNGVYIVRFADAKGKVQSIKFLKK